MGQPSPAIGRTMPGRFTNENTPVQSLAYEYGIICCEEGAKRNENPYHPAFNRYAWERWDEAWADMHPRRKKVKP